MLIFYPSHPPRVLHSFPTRRSSDLPGTADAQNGALSQHATGAPPPGSPQPRSDLQPPLAPGTPLERLDGRSEEHTSELQSRGHLVCRLLLEKKKHATQPRNPIGQSP